MPLIGAFLLFGAGSRLLMNRTQAGADAAARANGLKKFLKDFSRLEEAPVGHLILWERYLVYAVALGVSAELLQGLTTRVPAVANDPNFGAVVRRDGGPPVRRLRPHGGPRRVARLGQHAEHQRQRRRLLRRWRRLQRWRWWRRGGRPLSTPKHPLTLSVSPPELPTAGQQVRRRDERSAWWIFEVPPPRRAPHTRHFQIRRSVRVEGLRSARSAGIPSGLLALGATCCRRQREPASVCCAGATVHP